MWKERIKLYNRPIGLGHGPLSYLWVLRGPTPTIQIIRLSEVDCMAARRCTYQVVTKIAKGILNGAAPQPSLVPTSLIDTVLSFILTRSEENRQGGVLSLGYLTGTRTASWHHNGVDFYRSRATILPRCLAWLCNHQIHIANHKKYGIDELHTHVQ